MSLDMRTIMKGRHPMRHSMIMIVAAALTTTAIKADAFTLRGYVVATGGTPATGITGSGRAMYGTVGQSVAGVSSATRTVCDGFWCFGGVRVVAVEPQGTLGLPPKVSFSAPRPNPAHDRVGFELALPGEANVILTIFDLHGRHVLTMLDRRLQAGNYRVQWDGMDGGSAGGAGIYFARLLVDGRPVATQRIVMLR